METCSPIQLLQWPLILVISVVLFLLAAYYRKIRWRLYLVLSLFGASACPLLTYSFYRLAILNQESQVMLSSEHCVDCGFAPVSKACFDSSIQLAFLPFGIILLTLTYQFFRRRLRKAKPRKKSQSSQGSSNH